MAVVKPFRTDGDNYLRKTNTDGDVARQSVIQAYEKQAGSDGVTANTIFTLTLPYAPDSNTLMVFVNGQKAELVVSATDTTEYEETNSVTVTFGASLLDTDVVEFMVVGNYTLADGDIYYSKSSDNVRKNLIINGDMRIAQRGTSFLAMGNGDVQYTLDRWEFQEVGSPTGELDVKQLSAGGAYKYGFHNQAFFEVATADAAMAATDIFSIRQKIEGLNFGDVRYGTANAKDMTLSFYFWTNKAGTYSLRLYNQDEAYSYIHEFTPAAISTWEKFEVTISGDTVRPISWDKGVGLRVEFILAAGSTYKTSNVDQWIAGNIFAGDNQVNFMDSTDNQAYLTGVQLEIGSEATPFDYRSLGEELDLCQRYFEKSFNYTTVPADGVISGHFPGMVFSSTGIDMFFAFQTMKRAAPTISYYYSADGGAANQWTHYDAGFNALPVSGVHLFERAFTCRLTGSGLTPLEAHMVSGHWTADAEL